MKRYGRAEPRIFTPSLRPLEPRSEETERWTMGYSAIDFAENVLELRLFPWQKFLMIHGLELLEDGSFRFRTVVVLAARQGGKSTISQVLSLWFMFVYGYQLVIGTAQDLDVAEEIWQGAVDMVEETPELLALWERTVKVNGKKSLELKTGQRYKVKAASRRAGRGLSGDLILLDELREQQDWQAWSAITHTTMARPDAMIWGLSNAGDSSSIVLRYLRMMAHKAIGDPDGINASGISADEDAPSEDDDVEIADETSLGIFEWSAPPGCATDDRDGWAYANPSLGHSITERTIASAQRIDPEPVFRCLDVATPVLTMRGWQSMGALTVGEKVKGLDGSWIDVLGVSPVHYGRDCYRVTLNDGRSIICDSEHLWTVSDRRRPGPRQVLRTRDLIDKGVTYRNPSMAYDVRNFSLPHVEPLHGPDVDLPIHPYLLGLWLGDGACHAGLIFVESRDEEHVRGVMEACGAVITRRSVDSANCIRLGFNLGRRADFTTALHDLGIFRNKHIPDVYLTGSFDQRLWLLRGLMDSDGTVSKRTGRSTFTNTEGKLVFGVRTLIRSLGWKTSDLEPGLYGESHHLPRYDVSFTTRIGEVLPVTIPRKASEIRSARSRRGVRPITIVSIESVPSVPVRCIAVDAPDSLFLAGDLIPTHNTEVLCQWVETLSDGPFPLGAWAACEDRLSDIAPGNPVVAGVDVSWDRGMAYIAICGRRPDGDLHVEIVAQRAGTDWVVPWLTGTDSRGVKRSFAGVAFQANGAPVSSLKDAFVAAELPVIEWGGADLGRGYGRLWDLVRPPKVENGVTESKSRMFHLPQPVLDVAAAQAKTKPLGDSWVIERRHSPVDAAPLIAAAAAIFGLEQFKAPFRSRYESEGASLLVL